VRLGFVVFDFFHFVHELKRPILLIFRKLQQAIIGLFAAFFLPKIYGGTETDILELIASFSLLGGGCIDGGFAYCR
jgi:hypothetical protein